tara:strand:- start:863 stop:1093 length:231 start_codon:yes stop_codon:yes gene_type:complete
MENPINAHGTLGERSISVPVYFSWDDAEGYHLDFDTMKNEIEKQMEQLEEDVNELNYAHREHLHTKHYEGTTNEEN